MIEPSSPISSTLSGAYNKSDNSAHSTIKIQVLCDSETKVYLCTGKHKHICTQTIITIDHRSNIQAYMAVIRLFISLRAQNVRPNRGVGLLQEAYWSQQERCPSGEWWRSGSTSTSRSTSTVLSRDLNGDKIYVTSQSCAASMKREWDGSCGSLLRCHLWFAVLLMMKELGPNWADSWLWTMMCAPPINNHW